MKKYVAMEVALGKLVLDPKNPRFADLYEGKSEHDIIDYLLNHESAKDIAEEISRTKEFYADRPLWVLRDGESYLVKDGNRRCAAVKSLQNPNLFDLKIERHLLEKLPVFIYLKKEDLEYRIRKEHTANLSKKWSRLAKAVEVLRMWNDGESPDSLLEFEKDYKNLIKLASFYEKSAEVVGKKRMSKLMIDGKIIIFERLFNKRTKCGYSFKQKVPLVEVHDGELFKKYIFAVVKFLEKYPKTGTKDVNKTVDQDRFLKQLIPFGFTNDSKTDLPKRSKQNRPESDKPKPKNVKPKNEKVDRRPLVKKKPKWNRKNIPGGIKQLIDECYALDSNQNPNAKAIMTRVVFENVLKYIVENTKHTNGKYLSKNDFFRKAFRDKHNTELLYIDFKALTSKFVSMIKNTGMRKSFESFDLQMQHQLIHNYRVVGAPKDAEVLCTNLIGLVEFMLDTEITLLNTLELGPLT